MKSITTLAFFATALVAAVPFASSSTLIEGQLNTVGSATYGVPTNMLTVTSAGSATLDLVTPGITTGTNPGIVTGPPATGSLAAFYPSATVVDYSFDTATISSATPTKILSFANGTDTITFFATSIGAFTATSMSTEGAIILFGYLSATGPNFTSNPFAELDIAANGIGNNFTEDLAAHAPEPSSLVLLGSGLMGAAGAVLRRNRKV